MPEQDQRQGMPAWLIGCLIVFVVIAALLVWGGFHVYQRFVKPAVSMAQGLAKEMQRVNNTSEEAAAQAAGPAVDAAEVEANPAAYQGKWVAVKGKVSAANTTNQGGASLTLGKTTFVLVSPQAARLQGIGAGDEVLVVGVVSNAFSQFFTTLGIKAPTPPGGSQGPASPASGVFILARSVKPVAGAPEPEKAPAEDTGKQPAAAQP